MVSELRGAPLLTGARGQTPVERVLDAVDAVARLAMGLGDALDSLEVNPLLAQHERVEALDALAVLTTSLRSSQGGL